MAIKTYPVALKTGTDYATATKLIQTTTLSDDAHTYIDGIKDQQALEFTANYAMEDLKKANALSTETTFWLEFGEGGVSGIFTWKGTASAFVNGEGVNGVVEMTITSTPSTPVVPYEKV